MNRNSLPTRSTRLSFKPIERVADFEHAWIHRIADISDHHLRHCHNPACRSTSNCHRRHRLWIIATAVCVLSGLYSFPFLSCRNFEWLFWAGSDASSIAFTRLSRCVVFVIGNLILGICSCNPTARFQQPAHRWFRVLFITFVGFHLCLAEGPGSDESHFQRHSGDLRPKSSRLLRMKNDTAFNDAKRLYLEQYGDLW